MSDMFDFFKMMENAAREKNDDFDKWGKISYASEFDALCHAREMALLKPGQIVRFEYDGRNIYGVFCGISNQPSIDVLKFDKEHDQILKSLLSPDTILEVLSFEELKKRLS